MKLTAEEVQVLAKTVDLRIPEKDLENVTIRISTLLSAMEAIERELGQEMDAVDPLPPVFPREDY